MRKYIGILFLLLSLTAVAQTKAEIETALQNIDTPAKVKRLHTTHKTWNVEVVTLNSKEEDTPKELISLQKGQATIIRSGEATFHYKLLESSQGKEFRVGYIYLNGKELQKPQIDMFRSLIMERYEKGTSFKDLADTYNMDQNSKSEDLGWFKAGMMVPQFESAIRAHQKGDIFTVDVDDRKWYYVVLKTYEDRVVDYLTFVKIKEQ